MSWRWPSPPGHRMDQPTMYVLNPFLYGISLFPSMTHHWLVTYSHAGPISFQLELVASCERHSRGSGKSHDHSCDCACDAHWRPFSNYSPLCLTSALCRWSQPFLKKLCLLPRPPQDLLCILTARDRLLCNAKFSWQSVVQFPIMCVCMNIHRFMQQYFLLGKI